MIMLDSPSRAASLDEWRSWRNSLLELDQTDESVIDELQRADRLIAAKETIEREETPPEVAQP